MAATTTPRPPALPGQPQGKQPVPQGAHRMSRMYVDDKGLPKKAATPVPVDENDRRTAHVLHQCPHLSNINGGGKEQCREKEWLLAADEKPFCRRHGKQYEPDKSGPSQLELVLRDMVSLHGRSAAPWLVPATAVAADIMLSSPLETAGAIPVLAGTAYLATKRTLTKRAVARGRLEKGERTGRRYAALARQARTAALRAAEAGVWLTVLVGTDATSKAGVAIAAAGMLRWAIASRAWWMNADERRARGGSQVKADLPALAEQQPAGPDPVQVRAEVTWNTLIGHAGGPLPGTRLVDFKRLPNCQVRAAERTLFPNWSAKVVAKVEGSINMREFCTPLKLGRIAAAFELTFADVSFAADETDLGVAWVRVQPDNPLAETRMWTGPDSTDWVKGVSQIGRFDDGKPISYQWFNKQGAAHDLIGGSSGSGKSEVVAQLLLTSLHSNGLVLDWVGDPQGGQSYGQLKDEVDWFARDHHEITLMLLAAVKEMYRRNDALSADDTKTWQPSRDMPLLVITLDEVQDYLDDSGPVHELITKLAGMGRKCGIKLRLITQIIAAYNLGGSTYIKDQVKIGQTLTFRSETEVASRSAIEGDSPIDPTMLPKVWSPKTCAAGETTAGLMFVQGLHGRDVYGRADYTGEKLKPWLTAADGTSTVTSGRFSQAAQETSGVLWGDRKERARRLIDAGRSDEDLLSGGKAVELLETAAVVSVTKAPLRGESEGQAPLLERARDLVFKAACDHADSNGVVLRDRLVEAVEGKMATGTLNKALTELVGEGFLARPKNGLYVVSGMSSEKAPTPGEAGQ